MPLHTDAGKMESRETNCKDTGSTGIVRRPAAGRVRAENVPTFP